MSGLTDVRVSEIPTGYDWLYCGAWVRVVAVDPSPHPDDRVTITYEQDGGQETTREFHGYERAAVRPAGGAG